MPSPKTTLDLEAWGNFLPKERSNDYEYNLLLYKFRTFYNEVRDYHRLHSNCSITNDTSHNTSNENNGAAGDHSNSSINDADSSTGLPSGQYLINLKKKLFQNHDNGLPSHPNQNLTRQQFHKNQEFHQKPLNPSQRQQQTFDDSSVNQQHSTSSQNLALSGSASLSTCYRPETANRGPFISRSRLLFSKSSERLDTINNNSIPQIASSFDEQGFHASHRNGLNAAPIARDSRFLQNDDNIYDAVSPDDDVKPSENVARNSFTLQLNSSLNGESDSCRNISKHSLASTVHNLDSSQTPIVPSKKSIFSTPINPDKERSNNSFSSSIILDSSNNTSSSPSLNPSFTNQQEYGNYVNIDFFLKRSHSPSFDGLEEEASSDVSDNEEESTAQISHSISSDQICEDVLKNLSPKELARKLSNKDHQNNSSTGSITPASSGDFLDDIRSSTNQQSSSNQQFVTSINNKATSFHINRSKLSNAQSLDNRSSTAPRESGGSKASLQYQKTLEIINESLTISPPTKHQQYLNRGSDSDVPGETQGSMRSFLSDLNLSPIDDVFEDKAQRRIVKESFAVELCGRRKLRHLFLFNDVIVCAKYQASSKQKFTFDVKWYLNLQGVTVTDATQDINGSDKFNRESIENEILAIRTNLLLLRSRMQHIKRHKDKKPSKLIKKLKKKRTELEADLVLLLPHLPLIIKHVNGKKYTFFLSSNFDRNQWIESIKFLQSQLPVTKFASSTPSSSELQAWIQTCRKKLNPSLGTFLLRSNCDEDLLYGDLYVNTTAIKSIPKPGHYYFCFEVDSYGHFSQKASSVVLKMDDTNIELNDEYVIPLDGAHTLRVLLYEDLGQNTKPSVVGKAHIELSRTCFLDKPVEKSIGFGSNCNLIVQLSFLNSELLSLRVPHTKLCPSFGLDITQVCKKEKTEVPLLIQLCVNEVERRGMREVGIYRMSGTSTDIQRLKKAFDTNPYVAELLLKDIDINSVTGFLKQYLREMPEGLFINKLYPKFVAAFNIPQSEPLERARVMLELFHKIPISNQRTIIFLVEHLVKVNHYENYNKMSLTNLATVLGPNILRPPAANPSSATSSDPFTAVVIGSMSQAGILYFFLNRRANNLPLLELDSSELAARQSDSQS